MELMRLHPWSDFDHLHARMGRLLETGAHARQVSFTPPVDVRETESAFILDVDLPGVSREAVTIEVVDGVLSVRGDRARPTVEQDGVHRFERRFGSFERAFRLPKNVDGEAITARTADGVLTLTLPKKPEAQPRKIEIQA